MSGLAESSRMRGILGTQVRHTEEHQPGEHAFMHFAGIKHRQFSSPKSPPSQSLR